MDHTGIKIDDKHTERDWGLRMISMVIPMPEPKTNYIDIPGADGSLDLTQSLTGNVPYNMREGVQFTFDASGAVSYTHLSPRKNSPRRVVFMQSWDLGLLK